MAKLQTRARVPNSGQSYASLTQSIAHHDAAIEGLAIRMGGVEGTLKTFQHDVSTGLQSLSSKFDKIDAQPRLDMHKAVQTVLALSILFSMVVGGIIWVTTSQFGGLVAKQEHLNAQFIETTKHNAAELDVVKDKLGWVARIESNEGKKR